jgi:hypothetical protein
MNPEISQSPAAEYVFRSHAESRRFPVQSNPIVSVEPISEVVARALDVEDYLYEVDQIPAVVESVELAIADAFEDPLFTPYRLDRYLPENLRDACEQKGLTPVNLIFSRLARDRLEFRDFHRFTVRDRYQLAHDAKLSYLYPDEVWETIQNISEYKTNNDSLVFMPDTLQEAFLGHLTSQLDFQMRQWGPARTVTHTRLPYVRPGLSILVTDIGTGGRQWQNNTILMDPTLDLWNDYRIGPQHSEFENLSLLVAQDRTSGTMVHAMSQAWFMNRRMMDIQYRIDQPNGYRSRWEWFNAVTRMAYQLNRSIRVSYPADINRYIDTVLEPETLAGLRDDFQRLEATTSGTEIDPVQKNYINRQLITMIELGRTSSVMLFDKLGALPAMVRAFGGDPDAANGTLPHRLLKLAEDFDSGGNTTNVQLFVASLQEYANQTTGKKPDVLPDVDGLMVMLERINEGIPVPVGEAFTIPKNAAAEVG